MKKGEPIVIRGVSNGFVVSPVMNEPRMLVQEDEVIVFQRLTFEDRARLADDPESLVEWLQKHFEQDQPEVRVTVGANRYAPPTEPYPTDCDHFWETLGGPQDRYTKQCTRCGELR